MLRKIWFVQAKMAQKELAGISWQSGYQQQHTYRLMRIYEDIMYISYLFMI